jgi:hypothetical protein
MENIENLKSQARQYLELRKNIKDVEERKRLFNEYSKLHLRIKYHTDQQYKEEKKKQSKEHHDGLKDNEYYLKKRNEYFKDYYYKHKHPTQPTTTAINAF